MLIFTNRKIFKKTLTTQFEPESRALSCVDVDDGIVSNIQDDNDAQFFARIKAVFDAPQPVLVFIHGNGNPPERCVARCRMLEEIYNVNVIGFSWPSEGIAADVDDESDDDGEEAAGLQEGGKRERFKQATQNAVDSAAALTRFLQIVASVSTAVRESYSVAVHSLGNHLFRMAVAKHDAANALKNAANVILLAPCTDADDHAEWVGRIKPAGATIVTYNAVDLILAAALIADGGKPKLGVDPGKDLAKTEHVRYVDFQGATLKLSHRYYVWNKKKKMGHGAYDFFQWFFRSNVASGTELDKRLNKLCEAMTPDVTYHMAIVATVAKISPVIDGGAS